MDGARYNREEGVIDDQKPVSFDTPKCSGRTLQPNAADLVQASRRLRAQRGRVFLPLLQDRQARGYVVYDRPVD